MTSSAASAGSETASACAVGVGGNETDRAAAESAAGVSGVWILDGAALGVSGRLSKNPAPSSTAGGGCGLADTGPDTAGAATAAAAVASWSPAAVASALEPPRSSASGKPRRCSSSCRAELPDSSTCMNDHASSSSGLSAASISLPLQNSRSASAVLAPSAARSAASCGWPLPGCGAATASVTTMRTATSATPAALPSSRRTPKHASRPPKPNTAPQGRFMNAGARRIGLVAPPRASVGSAGADACCRL